MNSPGTYCECQNGGVTNTCPVYGCRRGTRSKADELLRELVDARVAWINAVPGSEGRLTYAFATAGAYLNEKPHEPTAHTKHCTKCGASWTRGADSIYPVANVLPDQCPICDPASPPHAAARDPQRIDDWHLPSTHADPPAPAAAEPEKPRIRVGEFNVECTVCGMHWSRFDSTEAHEPDCPNAPPVAAEPVGQPVAWMVRNPRSGTKWLYDYEDAAMDAADSMTGGTVTPLYASPSAQPIAPPREPTEAMLAAMAERSIYNSHDYSRLRIIWRAGYNAALKSAGKEST